jgi:4-hydroxy-2-oxoheptanedioate aldolase
LNFNATTTDYFAKFDEECLIVLQCEHIDSVRNFDEVYGNPRIDAVFVGPNDLMATMRDATGKPPSPEVFEKALQDVLAGCKRLGIAAGLHTFSVADAKKRIAEGWQFIAVNSELRFMTDGAKQTLDGLGMGKGVEGAKY